MKKLRILTEASGSLTAGYLIRSIKDAGHISVASDLNNHCFGRYIADDYIETPSANDAHFWKKIITLIQKYRIDVVIPSLDETLLGWSQRKVDFLQKKVHVIISPPEVISIFRDKWHTFNFFQDNGIPTPKTSLSQEYSLVKPRQGRGAVGVKITSQRVDMSELVSQEILSGAEYTIDVFCDKNSDPIYIVPRRRQNIREGKSTGGITENNQDIITWVKKICGKSHFVGPINIQCFCCDNGEIKFTEINPRVAGGMALGFAATQNWIDLVTENLIEGQPIIPKPVAWGLEMRRYYAEIFIPPDKVAHN